MYHGTYANREIGDQPIHQNSFVRVYAILGKFISTISDLLREKESIARLLY